MLRGVFCLRPTSCGSDMRCFRQSPPRRCYPIVFRLLRTDSAACALEHCIRQASTPQPCHTLTLATSSPPYFLPVSFTIGGTQSSVIFSTAVDHPAAPPKTDRHRSHLGVHLTSGRGSSTIGLLRSGTQSVALPSSCVSCLSTFAQFSRRLLCVFVITDGIRSSSFSFTELTG